MQKKLTRADVDRLIKDSSPDVRADTAAKVASQIDMPELNAAERVLVEDICRLMLRDAEIQVRAADALVDSEKEEVVAELVANSGAEMREATLARVVEQFKDSDRIKTPLVHRSQLPVRVAERLLSLVSEQLREHLISHHDLPDELANDIVDQSRERATMTLSSVDTAAELVRTLAANGRLTSSIIIRAVCMGDMFFFEWALAMLTKTPIENARTLIHDRDPRGLRSMLLRCGLPSVMFPIVRTAVDLWREMEFDGDALDRERYSRRMIERVITNFPDPSSRLDPSNLEYLLGKINELSAAGAVARRAAVGE